MNIGRIVGVFGLALCVGGAELRAAEPCQSGLQTGQRPGPYSFVISTGKQRGQSCCFICETADRPAVVVFARTLTDSLGKMVRQIDQGVANNKGSEMRAWVTFLSEDQPGLDPKVVQWSKKHATGNVPLGVFEDPVGPPTYLLAREAEVTVLLSVKQKVVANFAFRAGELNDAGVFEIMKALPKIVREKK